MPGTKLKFIDLMNELLFVKVRAIEYGLSDFQIKNLKFAKTDSNGMVTGIVNGYKLNIAKYKGEAVIVMLNK